VQYLKICGKEAEKVRSWIILMAAVLGLCFCGMLVAQDQPADTSSAGSTEEGSFSPSSTAGSESGEKSETEKGSVPSSEEKAPKSEEEAPMAE